MSDAVLELPDGRSVPLDEKGYLTDGADWSPRVAAAMASADGLELSDDHWAILELFREYFEQYEIEPSMRALIRLVRDRLGEAKANSRFLYGLFPEGPIIQACRYAGLPRPLSCV